MRKSMSVRRDPPVANEGEGPKGRRNNELVPRDTKYGHTSNNFVCVGVCHFFASFTSL